MPPLRSDLFLSQKILLLGVLPMPSSIVDAHDDFKGDSKSEPPTVQYGRNRGALPGRQLSLAFIVHSLTEASPAIGKSFVSSLGRVSGS